MDGIKINDRIAKKYRPAGDWTDETLGSCWANSVAKFGGREFVADDRGTRCTYSQLDVRANALANYLEALGICAGDIVTVQITPRSEFVIALIACIKIGAVPAPLGLCFVEEELLGLLKKLNSRLHIATSDYHGEDRAEMLVGLKKRLEHLDSLIFVGENSRELAKSHSFVSSFESIM
ncbi:MAG: AMP-binding protein, partial [Oscillospiraceae bacterium]